MGKEKEFTISELISFLQELEEKCGDYKIAVSDRAIHINEWTLEADKKQLNFKGDLFNEDILQKAIQLEEDIKTSVEKFYRK